LRHDFSNTFSTVTRNEKREESGRKRCFELQIPAFLEPELNSGVLLAARRTEVWGSLEQKCRVTLKTDPSSTAPTIAKMNPGYPYLF
jgi:hypothetical protein